jgi:uncharacterized membrane protein YqgA involved in biofilm formation
MSAQLTLFLIFSIALIKVGLFSAFNGDIQFVIIIALCIIGIIGTELCLIRELLEKSTKGRK